MNGGKKPQYWASLTFGIGREITAPVWKLPPARAISHWESTPPNTMADTTLNYGDGNAAKLVKIHELCRKNGGSQSSDELLACPAEPVNKLLYTIFCSDQETHQSWEQLVTLRGSFGAPVRRAQTFGGRNDVKLQLGFLHLMLKNLACVLSAPWVLGSSPLWNQQPTGFGSSPLWDLSVLHSCMRSCSQRWIWLAGSAAEAPILRTQEPGSCLAPFSSFRAPPFPRMQFPHLPGGRGCLPR